MSIPVVTCGADQIISYGAAQTIQLTCTATNTPTSFRWELRSAPEGSTAFSETRADFINGVSTIQNPQFTTDINLEGTYCFECVATNTTGESKPLEDKENGQQNIVVRTELYQLTLPNDYQWFWGDYNNNNFLTLEELVDRLKTTALDTTSEYLNDKITVAGGLSKSTTDKGSGNLALEISPMYGSSTGTVCEGDDSRLSDDRNPTSHSSTHVSGGSDSIKLDDLDTPDDNTDLDATTSTHGLLPKLEGSTTNFLRADGTWAEPAGGTNSPLTTKGDIYTYDTDNQRLPIGADGQVLKVNSATSTGLEWAAESGGGSVLTTKGDIATYDTADARLPVGANGQVLTVDNAETTGLKWTTLNSLLGADSVELLSEETTSSITFNNTTSWTKILPSTSGYTFTPVVSGPHYINWQFMGLIQNYNGFLNFHFRAKFDDTVSPVYGGGDPKWTWRVFSDTSYDNFSFQDVVNLVGGTTYTVTIEAIQDTSRNTTLLIPESSGVGREPSIAVIAVGANSSGGGFDREQVFIASALGQEIFTISTAAATNANHPSGYSVRVYVNGLKHKYSASPGTREYDIVSSTQIRVGGLNINDDVEIIYGAA